VLRKAQFAGTSSATWRITAAIVEEKALITVWEFELIQKNNKIVSKNDVSQEH
jgi:hypothetical protein